jgi:hypothetical protein
MMSDLVKRLQEIVLVLRDQMRDLYAEDVEEAIDHIEELEAELENTWISVEDKPLCRKETDGYEILIDDPVLMFVPTKDGGEMFNALVSEYWDIVDPENGDSFGYDWEDVTHWMPLPEPPRRMNDD